MRYCSVDLLYISTRFSLDDRINSMNYLQNQYRDLSEFTRVTHFIAITFNCVS